MNENALKREIVDIGKRLFQREFVAANDGNISVRISEKTILITPTGVSKGFMDPQDMIKVDIESGKVISGKARPSSEMAMHLAIYECRPDVQAVVHAHPPTATGFAVAGMSFDDIALPEAVIGLGRIELASYATPGTSEVPQAVKEKIMCSDVMLLANHGAVAVGDSLIQAYYRMESLEQVAKITLTAKLLGNVNVLNEEQQAKLFSIRKAMGLRDYNLSCNACGNCNTQSKQSPSLNGTSAMSTEELVKEIVLKVCSELTQRISR